MSSLKYQRFTPLGFKDIGINLSLWLLVLVNRSNLESIFFFSLKIIIYKLTTISRVNNKKKYNMSQTVIFYSVLIGW